MTGAPREHRLATPEGDICWFEWGAASDRPSVLLLHATGFHARLWDQVVLHLAPDTHVVAPDMRGHGRSFRPPSLGDWVASAAGLLPLVDRLAGRSLVGCGHSGGAVALTWLAAARPQAFGHVILLDPVIMDPSTYAAAGDAPFPDPADHPIAARRNHWDNVDQMIARFAGRMPYAAWEPAVLADYCRHGLLPAASGQGFELACPPALEASVYQGATRISPYAWLPDMAAPVTLIRAPTGERAGHLDFSLSPTWPGLGQRIGAVRDEQWTEHSHFIPMEAPRRVADLIAATL